MTEMYWTRDLETQGLETHSMVYTLWAGGKPSFVQGKWRGTLITLMFLSSETVNKYLPSFKIVPGEIWKVTDITFNMEKSK